MSLIILPNGLHSSRVKQAAPEYFRIVVLAPRTGKWEHATASGLKLYARSAYEADEACQAMAVQFDLYAQKERCDKPTGDVIYAFDLFYDGFFESGPLGDMLVQMGEARPTFERGRKQR